MIKQPVYDSHSHSHYSGDSRSHLDMMLEDAVTKGLKGVCVTDHFDVNNYPDGRASREVLRDMLSGVCDARERYRGRLQVGVGIELAQQEYNKEYTAEIVEIFEEYEPDLLIGSMHRGDNARDFSVLDFSACDFEFLLGRYYEQLLETVKMDHLDILAHITYPLRYAKRHGLSIDASAYDGITDEILKTLVANGKGIEINTSGIRQGHGETFPPYGTVRRYRELGGEIITVGSDSHTDTDLGADFDVAFDLLKQAGFRYYCWFERRRPVFVRIV